MVEIELQGSLDLDEPIVLATQENLSFKPASIGLPSGSVLRCRLVVSKQRLIKRYAQRKPNLTWYVNSPVRKLSLLLRSDIDSSDLARLNGVHSDAERFQANGHGYQYAKELARRFGTDIISGVNQLLRHIRDSFGQEWLQLLDEEGAHDNLFFRIGARWRLPPAKWQPFVPVPTGITLRGAVLGAADQYLELADWRKVCLSLKHQDEPSPVHSILADARHRYRTGDLRMAITQLNAAFEWAAEEFVYAQVSGSVPDPILKAILKQSYDRLLSDWVLPLADQAGIDLRSKEWPVIQKIKKLRNAALHPGKSLPPIDRQTFSQLRAGVATAASRLLGTAAPKTPPYLTVDEAAGTGAAK